jgi:chlorophyll/bacteriochlorophyll a synthase
MASHARSLVLPAPSAILELFKPITWFAPMWAFGCGIVSSGQPVFDRLTVIAAGIALSGPLVCAMSQAANDWYDRHVDAINEPHRPIPSGRIPGRWGLIIAVFWSVVSLLVALALGPIVLAAACVGVALAWAYSAPPFRLKENGWAGNLACGLCYESLPWFTGAAVMAGGLPDARSALLALLFGLGAHGIMTLNDFKSVEGDRRMGIRSLPVTLGVNRAARVACWVMGGSQAAVILLLIGWGKPIAAVAVWMTLGAQVMLMRKLLQEPAARAAWYNATGTSFYVLGMLASALAVGSLIAGGG